MIKKKISDYNQFFKLRLTFLVVLSAVFSFLLVSNGDEGNKLMYLIIGGLLVNASSNGFNQIIERNLDKLMKRTANRPLPSGRMSLNEAYISATVAGIIGIALLWFKINMLSGILGALALVLYTFVYTPLKQKTPFSVFVGAFPGAIPSMLGCVAVTNDISLTAVLMFSIQFVWQFPHFWAIAWVLDDDYKRAGFKMLPNDGGRNKNNAFLVLVYTLGLLPVSVMPVYYHVSGSWAALVVVICGLLFTWQAVRLYKTCEIKAASQLMFGSFLYLPLVQMALLLDKV